jgi:uncharacterized protein with PQ loop repeat
MSWLFVASNTGRLIAYLPQIRSAWNCPAGARSVSLLTWSYFAFAHLTALLYSIYVLHDERASWIFAGNLGVTVFLVTVLLIKRAQFPRRISRSVRVDDAVLERQPATR